MFTSQCIDLSVIVTGLFIFPSGFWMSSVWMSVWLAGCLYLLWLCLSGWLSLSVSDEEGNEKKNKTGQVPQSQSRQLSVRHQSVAGSRIATYLSLVRLTQRQERNGISACSLCQVWNFKAEDIWTWMYPGHSRRRSRFCFPESPLILHQAYW